MKKKKATIAAASYKSAPGNFPALHGIMRNSVLGLDNIDLTRPIVTERFDAEKGKLHAKRQRNKQ